MADSFTTHYNLTKPEVGASSDSWGDKLNADLDSLDGMIAGLVASGAIASAQATLDIELPAGFNSFQLRIANIVPVGNGQGLLLRAAVDGVPTWLTGANSYVYAIVQADNQGDLGCVGSASAGAPTTAMALSGFGGGGPANGATYGNSVIIDIASHAGADTAIEARLAYAGQSGTMNFSHCMGRVLDAAPATWIRLYFELGNIAQANWALYAFPGL